MQLSTPDSNRTLVRSTHLQRKIEDAEGDGRALWKSLNSILTPPAETDLAFHQTSSPTSSREKTESIREATKDSIPPTFIAAQNQRLPAFYPINADEVEQLLGDSSTKQCELDTTPVWLLKKLRIVFAPILALLINISISQAILPASQKQAIIRPRLKKPGIDPSDPANYRPI